MIVDYIDGRRDRFGVEPICTVLRQAEVQIAPSSYYAAKSRPPSARSVSDAALTEVIGAVHADNYGVYGAHKIHAELRRTGRPVARPTVERLMTKAALRRITKTKGPRTTVPGYTPPFRMSRMSRSRRVRSRDPTACVIAPTESVRPES